MEPRIFPFPTWQRQPDPGAQPLELAQLQLLGLSVPHSPGHCVADTIRGAGEVFCIKYLFLGRGEGRCSLNNPSQIEVLFIKGRC